MGISPGSHGENARARMDGRVLEEIFLDKIEKKVAPLYVSEGKKGSLSEGEKELIENRLRKLGYIS